MRSASPTGSARAPWCCRRRCASRYLRWSNTFIGFFKDTSLVVVIGLFDLLSTVKTSLNEPAWTGFGVEAYLFAALVYFAFCWPMSLYSRGLERAR